MIHREETNGVLVLRIEHGKANTIDLELIEELVAALDDGRTRAARAIVLTGAGPMFSAGVDLFRIVDGGPEYVRRFVPALGDLLLRAYTVARPMVAAIGGHAIAGGCLLAVACDYRVMAQGTGRIGVPELLVGVQFPAVAMEVLRGSLAPSDLRWFVNSGRTVDADEAVRRGVVDEAVAPDDVLSRALAVAAQLGAVPAATFEATKRALRAPVLERIEATRGTDPDVAETWGSDEVRAFVKGYLERSIGKSKK